MPLNIYDDIVTPEAVREFEYNSVIQDGLLLYLDAKIYNTISGTTWYDFTGNGYNGILYNGPTFDSSNQGSLSFDGSNDMVVINNGNQLDWLPDGSLGLSSFTIEMWVKSSDTGGVYYTKPWNGSGQYNIWIYSDQFYVSTGSGSNSILFGRQVSNNTWTHITCWANSTQIGYYINYNQFTSSKNHNLSSTIPQYGNVGVPTGLMTLYPYGGGWGGNSAFSIQGLLASCKVYNRVLSSSEIQHNYNLTKHRYGL